MAVIADLDALVAEGVLSAPHAQLLRQRSRNAMVALVINVLLAGGVIAAAAGLVLLLENPMAIALAGLLALGLGIVILGLAPALWRMFGHASALIGAAMLVGGGALQILDTLPARQAGATLAALGTAILLGFALAFWRAPKRLRLILGLLTLLGLGLQLFGLFQYGMAAEIAGLRAVALHLYATAAVLALGWFLDSRILTALAILPFAQVLNTSTSYMHAVYAFYSPEPTLSILQMALAIAVALWIAVNRPERDARHAQVFAVMAFMVANLCFLVGSLWGDWPGQSLLMAQIYAEHPHDWSARDAALRSFYASGTMLPDWGFAIVWAVLLAAVAIWAARALNRGLFNTAMTFGAIHLYTQMFERFEDEPLAFVIGGLAAVPLAWGIWRLNQMFR